MSWHIWTDGSCVHSQESKYHQTPKGGVGFGGWAAVVEHDSDGFVLRGRVAETTNVAMELVAVIEGLRAVPTGERAVVHTDSTVIVAVLDRWQRRHLQSAANRRRPVHWALWQKLAAEFDRIHVTIDLLGRGARDPIHKRAHALAGAEAKALLQIANGIIPAQATPLDPDDRRILGQKFRREVREWRDRVNRVNGKALPSSR
jgi:ribonuclease HI